MPGFNRRMPYLRARQGGRAGGGGAPWTPASDPLTTHWWRADLGLTLASGDVQHWDDQIDGHRLTQATASARPTPGTDAGFNGQAVLEFDGTDYLQGSGFTAVAQRYTAIVICEVDSGATVIVMDDGGGTADAPVLFYSAGTWKAGSGLSPNTGLTTLTGVSAWLIDCNNTSTFVYRDDWVTAAAGPLTGGTASSDSLTVGANNSGAGIMTGRVAEVIFTTQTDYTQLRAYVNARYGFAT